MASSAAASGRRLSSKLSILLRSHHLSASSYASLQHHYHYHSNPSPPPPPSPFSHRCCLLHHGPSFSALFPSRLSHAAILSSSVWGSPRHYSSGTIGGEPNNIEYLRDVTEVLTETAVETVSQAPGVVDEVAIAAADSAIPVAALQYVIDAVHSFTGLNWWAAIAVTTVLIRSATIPLLIHQIKATSKLTLLRPHLEELSKQTRSAADLDTLQENQRKMKKLYKEYGVTPFTPLMGLFIQGPIFISFYFAITNMAEKVPSFKGGGAFWFVDLTTPDPFYVFPVLTALSFLVNVELNLQEGMEGNPIAGNMKKFSRVVAVGTVPFTMNFPKAIFCYWITSNLFSLCYGLVIKQRAVKKYLGIPEIVPPPGPPPSISSLFGDAKSESPTVPVLPSQPTKFAEKKVSSSSAISHRLRNLERTVKSRKKNKKF